MLFARRVKASTLFKNEGKLTTQNVTPEMLDEAAAKEWGRLHDPEVQKALIKEQLNKMFPAKE